MTRILPAVLLCLLAPAAVAQDLPPTVFVQLDPGKDKPAKPEPLQLRSAAAAITIFGHLAEATLALVPIHAGDSPPAGASPASGPSGAATPAASRPAQAGDTTTRPVLQARSGIALFYLAHADAQRVAQILQQLFADEAPAVASDPRTNCIIVSGSALTIEKARQLIAKLDIPLASRPLVVVGGRPATRSATQPAAGADSRPSTGPATRPATSNART